LLRRRPEEVREHRLPRPRGLSRPLLSRPQLMKLSRWSIPLHRGRSLSIVCLLCVVLLCARTDALHDAPPCPCMYTCTASSISSFYRSQCLIPWHRSLNCGAPTSSRQSCGRAGIG
jgi:hypothetical protein